EGAVGDGGHCLDAHRREAHSISRQVLLRLGSGEAARYRRPGACSDLRTARETIMAGGLLFIVSRTKPGTYNYMKLVSESEHDVILDRRKGDRRRIHQRATPERPP